ncbi:MAG: nitrophenyl compound nitroreductase subunit ArsF family protein [Patescibacteria group bacterium]
MTKKNFISIFIIFILIIFLGAYFLFQEPVINKDNQQKATSISAEKIEVIHFHGTYQCFSCITVGELALKTIKEKFPEEYEQGKIVYEDINVDLRENKEIAEKYGATGSSLYINNIADGQDNIKEDITVWRLITDEEKYIVYLEDKLKGLLGKI